VLELAAAQDIRVALSNPCFEYWLLLHFRDHRTYAASYKQIEPVLRKHIPGHDKARLDFRRYAAHVPEAVDRAARRLSGCGGDLGANPSTTVHLIAAQFLPDADPGH
jgi:RloB-like protein